MRKVNILGLMITTLLLSQTTTATEYICASSVNYDRAAGFDCPGTSYYAMIDYNTNEGDYRGVMSFDMSTITGNNIASAKICGRIQNVDSFGASHTSRIYKESSLTCGWAGVSSFPGGQIGEATRTSNSIDVWQCIDITDPNQVPTTGSFYASWTGQDLNSALNPWTEYYGMGGTCANPCGTGTCEPYLELELGGSGTCFENPKTVQVDLTYTGTPFLGELHFNPNDWIDGEHHCIWWDNELIMDETTNTGNPIIVPITSSGNKLNPGAHNLKVSLETTDCDETGISSDQWTMTDIQVRVRYN